MAVYEVDCGFDGFFMMLNLGEASSPICIRSYDDDSDWSNWGETQCQTAHARHDLESAAILCIKAFGPDWYASPGQDIQAYDVPHTIFFRKDIDKLVMQAYKDKADEE